MEDKEQISVRQLQGRQMDSRNPVCHSKLHDFLLMKCIPFLLTIPQVSVHFPGRTIPWLPFFGWSSEGNSHPRVAPPQRAAAWLRLRLTKCDKQSRRPPSESCLFTAVHFFTCSVHIQELFNFVRRGHSHLPISLFTFLVCASVEIIESKYFTFKNLTDINSSNSMWWPQQQMFFTHSDLNLQYKRCLNVIAFL